MKTVGSFEAKTHLAALLERVAAGETIVITKHGKPVARLVPPGDDPPEMTASEAIAGLRELRQKHRVTSDEIRSLINEGRKY